MIHLGSTIVGVRRVTRPGRSPGSGRRGTRAASTCSGSTHHTLTGAPFGWNETNALQVQVLCRTTRPISWPTSIGDVAAWNVTRSRATSSPARRCTGSSAISGARVWSRLGLRSCASCSLAPGAREHVSLVHVEVLALLSLALVAASRRPSWLRFALVGGGELGMLVDLGLLRRDGHGDDGCFRIGAALVVRPETRPHRRRRHGRLVVRRDPAARRRRGRVGDERRCRPEARCAATCAFFGLRPVQLVVPSVQNIVFGDSLRSFWEGRGTGANLTETTNYLGLLTIALALGWIVFAAAPRATSRRSGARRRPGSWRRSSSDSRSRCRARVTLFGAAILDAVAPALGGSLRVPRACRAGTRCC